MRYEVRTIYGSWGAYQVFDTELRMIVEHFISSKDADRHATKLNAAAEAE